jgi:predicted outer membrane repeat protein
MRHASCFHATIISGLILVLAPAGAAAQGSIQGTVTFWGDPGTGTQVEIAAHANPNGPPDANTFVSLPGGPFSIPVADGTYYISALMARDGVFGEPRREDVLVWYDADGDGDRDTVTVSGGAATGIDVDLGFVYVDVDATGSNNGSSWTDAFTDLQGGIDLAVAGIEVWVAEGTYNPGVSRSDSFTPKNGVRVYGGFAGGETVRQQRDWFIHPTNLSGEIGAAAATDNCYHVVRAESSNPTAMLNGLTITRGYANGSFPDDQGGGVRARGGGLTLANVTLIDNYSSAGGGGAFANTSGTINAYNCKFVNNLTAFEGGGLYASVASSQAQTLVNCLFTGNSAFRGGGIALTSVGLQPVLVNLSLSGNSAAGEGGGIYVNTSIQYTIHNSILWGNSGPNPQISAYAGVGWPIVNSSIVQGGWTHGGTHILDQDPSFADPALRINLDSPAIDAGDSTAIPLDLADLDEDHWTDSEVNVDLDMNWRSENIPYIPDTGIPDPYGFIVDMGAYEAWDPAIIFYDGFESGGTWGWDAVVGEP